MVHLALRVVTAARQSPALRQSAMVTAGNVATGVIMAVAMILASRGLGPEKFGIFSVSIAIMGLLAKGVDFGLNQLIPRFMNRWVEEPGKQVEFQAQVIQWKLWLALPTFLGGLALIPFLRNSLNFPYTDMILWAVLGGLFLGVYEYVMLILSAKHEFFWLSAMTVGQAVVKFAGFLAIFLLSPGSLSSIVAIYYLAPFIAALAVGWQFHSLVWMTPKMAGKIVRQDIFRYLGHAAIGVLAMTLIMNLDVLLVQKYLNPFETGLYAGASRIASFIAFGTASVGGVLNNRVSRYRNKETLKKYLIKSLSLSAIAAIGFLFYLPFARLSLVLTIGPEYLPGLSSLVILVLNSFLSFAVVPFISFFFAVDHPRYFSFGGVLQVAVIVLINMFFLPQYGILAAAWAKVIATVAFSLYTAIYVLYAMRKLKS